MPECDSYDKKTKIYKGYFLNEHFPKILDILRNEKPLFIKHYAYKGQVLVSLATSEEPVGEDRNPGRQYS